MGADNRRIAKELAGQRTALCLDAFPELAPEPAPFPAAQAVIDCVPVSKGVIAPFPRPTPPVAQAERLWPYARGGRVGVSTPSIADGPPPRHHSTRSPADPG